jgi:Spy/CpxP family protein refolding chaperone
MMGGYGPGYGMGPGMMGGYGPRAGWGLAALDLTDAQRAKIADIQREASRKQWDLMGKVHEQQYRLQEQYESGKAEDEAARKSYAAMADAHKQMFDIQLDTRKKIDAVLTPEQREQLRQGYRGRWGAPRPGSQK